MITFHGVSKVLVNQGKNKLGKFVHKNEALFSVIARSECNKRRGNPILWIVLNRRVVDEGSYEIATAPMVIGDLAMTKKTGGEVICP